MPYEKLEYSVVMDDGSDVEVLGRVRDLDCAAAVYMAAQAKYPNRNIRLLQGQWIMKRHDGEPAPVPEDADGPEPEELVRAPDRRQEDGALRLRSGG